MSEDIIESRGNQAFRIHGDPNALHALWCCTLNGGAVSISFSQDAVTPLREHPKSNIEAEGTAHGEGALPVLIGRVVDNLVREDQQPAFQESRGHYLGVLCYEAK